MCHRISIVCCSLIVCNLFRFGWMQSRIESWWLDMLYLLRSSVMTYYEYNCTSEELRLRILSFVPWTTTSSREWTNHSWQLVRYVLTVVKNPATVNDIDHWSFWIFQLMKPTTHPNVCFLVFNLSHQFVYNQCSCTSLPTKIYSTF